MTVGRCNYGVEMIKICDTVSIFIEGGETPVICATNGEIVDVRYVGQIDAGKLAEPVFRKITNNPRCDVEYEALVARNENKTRQPQLTSEVLCV